MNYRELQKLNEIIENLKAHPNSDENIQFVLDVADKSVQNKTLKTLIQNEKSNYGIEIEKAVLEKPLIQEVKQMLIQLKITASVRTRKDGLMEVRSNSLGSIYGRTKQELQEKLTKRLRENKQRIKQPRPTQKKSKCPTLASFYDTYYLPSKTEDKLAESTLKGIKYNFAFIVNAKFADKPLDLYEPKDIRDFLYSIEETRKRQLIHGLLNNIFKYALSLDMVEKNPCGNIAKTKHETNEGTAFSFAEQKEFFKNLFADETISYQKKCYLVYVYLTGTRRNEALSVQVDDQQENQAVLHVHGTKTQSSNRYMPLFPLVRKLLDSLTPKDGKYFPFSQYVADTTFKKYGKPHKLHDLRHTFGTIQICVNKIEAKTVSLYMGHSDVQTTLRIYTHPEQLNRAVFLNGKLTENEKLEHLKREYAEVLEIIDNFIK